MSPVTKVELDWGEASVAELSAPNGQVLVIVATPSLVRALHNEEGSLVLFKRPCSSLEQARRRALVYAKAWLASHTSPYEVYGEVVEGLSDAELAELIAREG